MNNQYLKKAELSRVVELCLPHLQKAGYVPETLDETGRERVTLLVKLLQDRLDCAADIVDQAELFFKDDIELENDEAAAIVREDYAPVVLAGFVRQVEQAAEWAPEHMKGLLKAVQAETGYKGKQLFMTTRVALTGQMHGPDLELTIYLLGKQKVVERASKWL
jgi:nondiscriminating glutamyl-tRNA synthetase